MTNSISVEEFKKIYKSVNIIDIRGIESYNGNHIEGAKNIDFNKLLISPSNYLNKNDVYYIYCQKGVKSSRLCSVLRQSGYKVINIIGGYEAWVLN